MSPDAQRVAIAEACGWTRSDVISNSWYHQDSPHCQDGQYCDEDDVPDYLTDLNAMHEAEMVLTEEQQTTFANLLIEDSQVYLNGPAPKPFLPIHATAAQRAESFLKTLNLWTT